MELFHFVNAEYGLEDLRRRRLKVARINELNDPFEFLGVNIRNPEQRKALQATKARLNTTRGLICFSDSWSSPTQWGHYADKHRGLCLGFEVPPEKALRIQYVNTRPEWPEALTEDFMMTLMGRKFSHWSYEREYRLYTDLAAKDDGGLYFVSFCDDLRLKYVIVGANSLVKRSEVASALGELAGEVRAFKARASFGDFQIVRNENSLMWR